MKRSALLLMVMLIFTAFPAFGQGDQGYRIQLTVEGLQDTTVIFGHYRGDKQYVRDTVRIDSRGVIVWKGEEILDEGMYLVVFPNNSMIDFWISEEQHFQLHTELNNLIPAMRVKGSQINEVFYDDMKFISSQRKAFQSLQEQLKENEGNEEAITEIRLQMSKIDEAVKEHRSNLIRNNPGVFYTKFLKASEDPKVPEGLEGDDAYNYYKANFFENLDFSDGRFLRTPIYHQRLERFIKQVTVQTPDSIIASADFVINQARQNEDLFRYTLAWLLNEHAGSKIMGMDAVYVHLAENYYMTGAADWVSEEQLQRISRDAMRLKPFLIGKQVPDIVARDINGKWQSLYDVDAEYTILYFWDSDCGHCRTETPKMYDVFQQLQPKGVAAYVVTIEYTEDKWREFIKEHGLTDWMNVQDFQGSNPFRRNYHITGTPTFFLLDKDKNIIAKRLNSENLLDFVNRIMERKENQAN